MIQYLKVQTNPGVVPGVAKPHVIKRAKTSGAQSWKDKRDVLLGCRTCAKWGRCNTSKRNCKKKTKMLYRKIFRGQRREALGRTCDSLTHYIHTLPLDAIMHAAACPPNHPTHSYQLALSFYLSPHSCLQWPCNNPLCGLAREPWQLNAIKSQKRKLFNFE